MLTSVVSADFRLPPPMRADVPPPIRIVVADDHPVVREGLQALLATQPDFEVAGAACNGLEALRMVDELEPDVILLDFSMPGMSGLDVAREMNRAGLATRVILLSVWVDKQDVVRLLEAGVRGVVLKEASMPLVFKSIRKVHEGELWVDRRTMANVAGARASRPAAATPRARDFGLTPREREVLQLVVAGDRNKDIAAALRVREDTVKHHVTSIFDKTGMSSRTALTRFALHHRLVDDR